MTLRHFNIFLNVCREKNMTKAAEKLYMTQPSITQAIKELEKYYGVLLFERIGKKISISREGYKLLPVAENIIKLFEDSKSIMKNEFLYECTIGTSVTVGTYLLSDIFKKLKLIPNLEMKYVVDNTHNIEQMILNSQIHMGIVEGEIHSKQIISIPFMKDELGLVCSSKNSFSQVKSIQISRLNGCNFIFREEGSGTKELIEAIFYQNNIKIESIGIVNNIEAIKNMIISDLGISILPKISVLKEIREGVLNYIEIEDIIISRNFKIVHHKDKILDKHLKKILDTLLFNSAENCI